MTTDFPRRRRKPTLSLPDVAPLTETVGNKFDDAQTGKVAIYDNENAMIIIKHLRTASVNVLNLPNTNKEDRDELLVLIQTLENALKEIHNAQAEEVAYRLKQLVEKAQDKHTTADEIEYHANLLQKAEADIEEVQPIVVKIATRVVGKFIGVGNV